jgi:hypothetical protein
LRREAEFIGAAAAGPGAVATAFVAAVLAAGTDARTAFKGTTQLLGTSLSWLDAVAAARVAAFCAVGTDPRAAADLTFLEGDRVGEDAGGQGQEHQGFDGKGEHFCFCR